MKKTIDANTAVSNIAYKCSDIAFIYPITPSSPMAENCDEMQSQNVQNIFGNKLIVKEMQSEGGVAGAVHGSLLNGELTTTFTSSQGLLLMIPNMYKIAGELLPAVFHIAARTIATHALNIFGDHSDVMSVRQTGFAMLCSNNAQEGQDLALASHITALKSSVPFLHFFDGFRTSHEISQVNLIDDESIKSIFPYDKLSEFKNKGMLVSSPKQFGTAQNSDVFFQNRIASKSYYDKLPDLLVETFEDIYKITGRKYNLFDYVGNKNAKTIFIALGSSTENIEEYINLENTKDIGLIKVRLFRPFSIKHFIDVLPKSTKNIIVLDKTLENGSIGSPLYQDIVSCLYQNNIKANIYNGIYGLGGKDFNLNDIHSIVTQLYQNTLRPFFTVSINDNITYTSIKQIEYTKSPDNYSCKFYGLGSDGTVSANKNTIKIIGDKTSKFVQGYFEYDSKKSGSMTISHLRFSDTEIKSHYLIDKANFIAVHNKSFINKYDILSKIKQNGCLLINSNKDYLNNIPNETVSQLINKNVKVYSIDAEMLANKYNLGNKINLIMQSSFFYLTDFIKYDTSLKEMQNSIIKTYKKLSKEALDNNIKAINEVSDNIQLIDLNSLLNENKSQMTTTKDSNEIYKVFNRNGNDLPVSYFNANGSTKTNTSNLEKRDIATILPDWIPEKCIQCGQCSFVCPHAVIRPILVDKQDLKDKDIKMADSKIDKSAKYILSISPKDCTGCKNCANICPVKAIAMKNKNEIFDKLQKDYVISQQLDKKPTTLNDNTVMGVQYKLPYFEYCGACAGCGETPYIRLLTQLFGNRLVIANATGCSSIYSGSYPSCPFSVDNNGLGPTWANSLFEDNAEFGYGMKIAINSKRNKLNKLINEIINENINIDIKNELLNWQQNNNDSKKSLESYKKLKSLISNQTDDKLQELKNSFDDLINKTVWIIGGDGWAYDIGFNGLDTVVASNENVNILILDTEVYSNTGGQASKSTPFGASAKFSVEGKTTNKKNLAKMLMSYKNVYVAQIAMGADKMQTIKTLKEAENFNGPSVIIAYSPCINHGIKSNDAMSQMKLAVESGYYHLFRYNPSSNKKFALDSKKPTRPITDFLVTEKRFLNLSLPEKQEQVKKIEKDSEFLFNYYEKLDKEDS